MRRLSLLGLLILTLSPLCLRATEARVIQNIDFDWYFYSVKIKSQLAVKRKRGDFVGSFATYGYQKDHSNHTKLIVDELAAETVQDIFLSLMMLIA